LRSAEGPKAAGGPFLPLYLFLIALATRIPFTSGLLYHMDSVQFALALDKYDITVHQPHPPGYFLYVMLGRVLNYFIGNANSVFICISILFGGLAVVCIYYLGKELYNEKAGLVAAAIALTSPNLWFHGEVALTYIVEAFFSTFAAFCCWRILQGERKYVWISVIVLGIAGGIRQNTMVFLLPLWLFSVKAVPKGRIFASLLLLTVVCLLWFIPMVRMTGGWDAYRNAFRELWLFNTGNVSVFEKGWATFRIFSSSLGKFTIYGVGTGIFCLGIAGYSLVRNHRLKTLDVRKSLFFALWILPAALFYLFIFIHPANPGYVLIFLPALFILTARSIEYIGSELKPFLGTNVPALIAAIIIISNAAFFLFSRNPVSYHEIRTHDRDLSIILTNIHSFDPQKTAIFVEPYIFYGYRQIMYYLPDYRVYQVDVRVATTGDVRKTFWGINRGTFVTDKIILPGQIKEFILPVFSDDKKRRLMREGFVSKDLCSGFSIISGPIGLIKEIYPELKFSIYDHTTKARSHFA
jgi:hypothetical protein